MKGLNQNCLCRDIRSYRDREEFFRLDAENAIPLRWEIYENSYATSIAERETTRKGSDNLYAFLLPLPPFPIPHRSSCLMYVDTGTRIYRTTRASQIIRVTARSESHLLRAPIHRVFLSHPFLFRRVRALFPLESRARKKVAIEANAGCGQNRESFLHDASQGKGVRRKQRA